MEHNIDLPRLPPWKSPQFRRIKHVKHSTDEDFNVGMGTSANVFSDSSLYTPLNYKNERNRNRDMNGKQRAPGISENTLSFKYDPSPFILHDNILNKTKVDQLQQQEVAMRRLFDKDRAIPESRLNVPYYQTLWREQLDLMVDDMPETSPKFDYSNSSQDLYKQLRQFQTAFVQNEAWKYEENTE